MVESTSRSSSDLPPPFQPQTPHSQHDDSMNKTDDTFQPLSRTDTSYRTLGPLKLRGETDDLPQSWWFASTAIPLIAATIGPLANVLSIAALVSKWRVELANNGQLPEGTDNSGVDIPDPEWEIICNAISLACGFVGNFFLLLNFTKRVRYILALPMTIIFWFLATGLLVGITACMYIYEPAISPGQTYSQGYWHAIIAAVLYMIGCVTLMINMMGYFMGKYPQHFDLDDDQRTLILQTMMFFFWLAGGAAVFQAVCEFTYSDALYFCDVTVLTVGFGDFVGTNDTARGLVFPYSVIGIIFLGLMINSIRKFAISMSKDKVIKKHEMSITMKAQGRTVSNERDLRERLGLPQTPIAADANRRSLEARKASYSQYGKIQVKGRSITFIENKPTPRSTNPLPPPTDAPPNHDSPKLDRTTSRLPNVRFRRPRPDRRHKLLLLRYEKDRFDTMREIQAKTRRFRQYYALLLSITAFGLLWCIGALVFMYAEQREQSLTYFQALYFCYVSLLTIGYGDFSPKSNAGKAFFVIWSLIAIPTMTILVSDMGDTVVSAINRGTFTLADWTVMPKKGLWATILRTFPRLRQGLMRRQQSREEAKRVRDGFALQDPDMEGVDGDISPPSIGNKHKQTHPHSSGKTLEDLAAEKLSDHQLARKLALAIKRVAKDLAVTPQKKYTYEEWVEFTRLIRFSARSGKEVEVEEEEDGVLEWDWIGEDSPMLSDEGEAAWVLERLCGSLGRYTRTQARGVGDKSDEGNGAKRRRRRSAGDRDGGALSDNDELVGDVEFDDETRGGRRCIDRGDKIEDAVNGHKRNTSDAVKAWEAKVEADRIEAKRGN